MINRVDGFPRTPYSMARVGGIWPGSVAVYVCRTKLAPNVVLPSETLDPASDPPLNSPDRSLRSLASFFGTPLQESANERLFFYFRKVCSLRSLFCLLGRLVS